MRIGTHDLSEKILVVAEIGNNHEGSFAVAQELVRRAADCGVDAVKFQTFRTELFVSPSETERIQRLRGFELSYRQFEQLRELAGSLGLLFMSTPLDLQSAAFLEDLVDSYKIASGDNNFYPLIDLVCRTGRPIIFSSGLSDLEQVTRTKQFIEERWSALGIEQELAVLHCVTAYPAPPEDVNLAVIPFLAQELRCTVGYSDHMVGSEAAVLSTALGARIVEKHFTLDKNYSSFRDHQLSADPDEMRGLVDQIRKTQVLLGRPEKVVQRCERPLLDGARRSIVAAADLPKGHCLVAQDLTWMRPGLGVPPGAEASLLGKRLKRAISFGEPILLSTVE